VPDFLHQTFHQTDAELLKQKFDTKLSGTTCVVLAFDRSTLFCANTGDSRAVLYSHLKQKNEMQITPLSIDHKPCMPVETKRVLEYGGRVDAIKGNQGQPLGPMRVWLRDQEAPGLAMSRSLGDQLAHSLGVSSDPEVMRFKLTQDEKFIIIASDGVWEFISNQEIAKLVWPFYLKNSPEHAGNSIVRLAAQKWRENDTVIDDITCITIFLEVDNVSPKIESAVYHKALLNSSTEFSVQSTPLYKNGTKITPHSSSTKPDDKGERGK
jgi:serine/threonine protein phosphatase PrpC